MSSSSHEPMLLVGGNCSIMGFDAEGKEKFWTVTGDNVTSMMISDINNDGLKELLVGSEDFELRIYQSEEVMDEVAEADKIILLHPITDSDCYIYALANGTVGVYKGTIRLWRVKMKHEVTCISSIAINTLSSITNQQEKTSYVLVGWSNGLFNLRNIKTGEVVFKDTFTSSISKILVMDYRMDGSEMAIVCCESGELKGYKALESISTQSNQEYNFTNLQSIEDNKKISLLQEEKLNLLNDLKAYEQMSKVIDGEGQCFSSDIEVLYSFSPLLDEGCISIQVEILHQSDATIVNIIAIDTSKLDH